MCNPAGASGYDKIRLGVSFQSRSRNARDHPSRIVYKRVLASNAVCRGESDSVRWQGTPSAYLLVYFSAAYTPVRAYNIRDTHRRRAEQARGAEGDAEEGEREEEEEDGSARLCASEHYGYSIRCRRLDRVVMCPPCNQGLSAPSTGVPEPIPPISLVGQGGTSVLQLLGLFSLTVSHRFVSSRLAFSPGLRFV